MKYYIFGLALAALAGCAVTSKTNSSDLHFFQTTGIVDKVKPLAVLEGLRPKQNVAIKLGISPTISLGDIEGPFEIVAIHGKAGKKFTVEVRTSLAYAFGVGAKAMAPGVSALVITRDGTAIGQRKRFNAGRIAFEGIFPSGEDFYIIAVADKRFKDQVVRADPVASAYGYVSTHETYGSLDGNITVSADTE